MAVLQMLFMSARKCMDEYISITIANLFGQPAPDTTRPALPFSHTRPGPLNKSGTRSRLAKDTWLSVSGSVPARPGLKRDSEPGLHITNAYGPNSKEVALAPLLDEVLSCGTLCHLLWS